METKEIRFTRKKTNKAMKTYYVMCDGHVKHTCKTKKTAIKYAQRFLDTMLYNKVTIDCLEALTNN